MYLDADLRVCTSQDVSTGTTDYSGSYDLTLSPDLGSGGQLVAVVIVEEYTAGSSASTQINIVTDASATFATSPKIVGSTRPILAAELEARDSTSNAAHMLMPIVVRFNPDHDTPGPVAGVTDRYLGLQFVHSTTCTSLVVSAYFTVNYQGNDGAAYFAPGMIVA